MNMMALRNSALWIFMMRENSLSLNLVSYVDGFISQIPWGHANRKVADLCRIGRRKHCVRVRREGLDSMTSTYHVYPKLCLPRTYNINIDMYGSGFYWARILPTGWSTWWDSRLNFLRFEGSPGLWATFVVTHCPSRMVEHPKSKSR